MVLAATGSPRRLITRLPPVPGAAAFGVSGAVGGLLLVGAFLGWPRRSPLGGCRIRCVRRRRIRSATRRRRCRTLLFVTDCISYAARARLGRARTGARASERAASGRPCSRLTARRANRAYGFLLGIGRLVAASLLPNCGARRSPSFPRSTPRAVVSAEAIDDAEELGTFKDRRFVASQLVLLGVLAIYAGKGARLGPRVRGRTHAPGCSSECSGRALVRISRGRFSCSSSGGCAATAAGGWLPRRFIENWLVLTAEFLFICLGC